MTVNYIFSITFTTGVRKLKPLSPLCGKGCINVGFDLTTRDSNFTILVEIFTNHILAEKHKFHESFSVNRTQDFCKHHLLQSRKQLNDKTKQLIMQAFIYHLVYSGVRNVFCKIRQRKEI